MGIVSTNVAFVSGNGSGSSGATGVDLPTHLESLTANGGNTTVTLNLGYSSTDYVSGIQINYKTEDYPTSPSDGETVDMTGAETSVKITGLANKLTYYFRVFLYNEVAGVKYYQTDITNARVTCMPRSVEIEGITIAEQGENYAVIRTSGIFTLSAPAGTRVIIGSGANGGSAYNTSGSAGQPSTLSIGSATYNSGTSRTAITTNAGVVGGGGDGGTGGEGLYSQNKYESGGTGSNGGKGGSPGGGGGNGGDGGSGWSGSGGGTGGKGGANGNGTPGSNGGSPNGDSGGKGGAGAPRTISGKYCYGGKGADGWLEGYDENSYPGANGGNGGYVAEYVLESPLDNVPCSLTIGTGGPGGSYTDNNDNEHKGGNGDSGVVILEWD